MKNGDQWKVMAIEIVDLPIKHGGSFHSYVKLPEGICWVQSICLSGHLKAQPLLLLKSCINPEVKFKKTKLSLGASGENL